MVTNKRCHASTSICVCSLQLLLVKENDGWRRWLSAAFLWWAMRRGSDRVWFTDSADICRHCFNRFTSVTRTRCLKIAGTRSFRTAVGRTSPWCISNRRQTTPAIASVCHVGVTTCFRAIDSYQSVIWISSRLSQIPTIIADRHISYLKKSHKSNANSYHCYGILFFFVL